MSEVRKLTDGELKEFIEIVVNAYPGVSKATPEYKERTLQRFIHLQHEDPTIDFFGLFRERKLIGGMRIHYHEMNLYTHIIPVGCVGLVAVDLLHKKEKVAKELIEAFIALFLKKGVNLLLLYPFRPDFYKKMGFGYGPKNHQYSFSASSFPKGPSKAHLRFLTKDDQQKVLQCYTKYAKATHGMFLKTKAELDGMFTNPDNRLIGYEEDNEVRGYLLFSFEKKSSTNFVHNDLHIKELIAESPEALMEIGTFLHSQADQVDRIIWNTQEENVHFFVNDPRNGTHHLIPSVYHESNRSGVGLMIG